jgi:hypothetical protein
MAQPGFHRVFNQGADFNHLASAGAARDANAGL